MNMTHIPFHCIPLNVWQSVHDKWVHCLMTHTPDWSPCEMCDHIWPRLDYDCADYCPLAVSDWCHNKKKFSKLHINYDDFMTGTFDPWETRVINFLEWLSIEIELWEENECPTEPSG